MPIIQGPDAAKPKGIAAMIVEGMASRSQEPAQPEMVGYGEFAAKQFISAVKNEDASLAFKAFKAMYKACDMEEMEG